MTDPPSPPLVGLEHEVSATLQAVEIPVSPTWRQHAVRVVAELLAGTLLVVLVTLLLGLAGHESALDPAAIAGLVIASVGGAELGAAMSAGPDTLRIGLHELHLLRRGQSVWSCELAEIESVAPHFLGGVRVRTSTTSRLVPLPGSFVNRARLAPLADLISGLSERAREAARPQDGSATLAALNELGLRAKGSESPVNSRASRQ